MHWFKNAIRFSIFSALYGVQVSTWIVLTLLRSPVQFVGSFLAFSGLVGGMLIMPAILYIGGTERAQPFPLGIYATFVGIGFLCFVGGGLLVVFYDTLLFKLQPQDRKVIYY